MISKAVGLTEGIQVGPTSVERKYELTCRDKSYPIVILVIGRSTEAGG